MTDTKPPTPLDMLNAIDHITDREIRCKPEWHRPFDGLHRFLYGLSPSMAQALSDPGMRAALEVIVAERERQIEGEGWSRKHDDQHDNCELAMAAAHFACADTMATVSDPYGISDWASSSTTHLRNLEKAGALIVAEIERIHRALKAKEEV